MRKVWALLLLLPVAAAQPGLDNPDEPTAATLWVHLEHFQDAPINTQEPPSWYVSSNDLGIIQHSQGCVENPVGGTVLTDTQHTRYGYVSPGPVEYDTEGLRYYNDRGLGYDLVIEPDSTPVVHWSLQTQWTTGAENALLAEAAPVVPNVSVRATLREGDQISVGQVEYNTGHLIATGTSEPATLHPLLLGDHPHVTHAAVDGAQIYDFTIPLDLESNVVVADEGLNLRIDVFMDNPFCNEPGADEYIMPDFVRDYSGPDHRPRIDLSVMNPLRIESMGAQIIGDDVLVHTSVASVWGRYDIMSWDNERAPPTAKVTGPGITDFELELVEEGEAYTHSHMATDYAGATPFAWLWSDAVSQAQAGDHTVEVRIENDQGSAAARGVGIFDVGEGTASFCKLENNVSMCTSAADIADNSNTPGAGLLLLPLLLAAVALRRR